VVGQMGNGRVQGLCKLGQLEGAQMLQQLQRLPACVTQSFGEKKVGKYSAYRASHQTEEVLWRSSSEFEAMVSGSSRCRI